MAANRQTYIHTYTRTCASSHASVGLAQARPNYLHMKWKVKHNGDMGMGSFMA